MKRLWTVTMLIGGFSAGPAAALTGSEYLQLDATHRAVHVMGMVEGFKYADDLTGDGSLTWLFECVGGCCSNASVDGPGPNWNLFSRATSMRGPSPGSTKRPPSLFPLSATCVRTRQCGRRIEPTGDDVGERLSG